MKQLQKLTRESSANGRIGWDSEFRGTASRSDAPLDLQLGGRRYMAILVRGGSRCLSGMVNERSSSVSSLFPMRPGL